MTVNSRHHQAVDRPGEGLRITARAPDGVVEVIEGADGAPLLGLQCHAEDLTDRPEFLAPFRWLAEMARQRRSG